MAGCKRQDGWLGETRCCCINSSILNQGGWAGLMSLLCGMLWVLQRHWKHTALQPGDFETAVIAALWLWFSSSASKADPQHLLVFRGLLSAAAMALPLLLHTGPEALTKHSQSNLRRLGPHADKSNTASQQHCCETRAHWTKGITCTQQ